MTEKEAYRPFEILAQSPSPKGLRQAIDAKIVREAKRSCHIRMVLFGFSFIVSLSALATSFVYAYRTLASSGFYDYISLAFSEGPLLLSYSRELALSMLESLPTFGLAAVLVAGLAVSWSLPRFLRVSRNSFLYA